MRIAEFSAQWEGRSIDGAFSLGQLLGTGENSAVFLSEWEGRPAAIKLLHVDPGKADAQLAQWRAAARLSHPNLIRIYRAGRCELDALPLVYVAMEHAEEDLSQVLPHRSLSPSEAREMLPPALGALEYLHKQGFVHARVKPSNIMAVDDCLKLSSDGVCRAGAKDDVVPSPYDPPERLSGVLSPAGDVWSLGMTLIEILTGRRPSGAGARPPADLPEPFSSIVRHALERDARERWTVPQISMYLADPEGAATTADPVRSKRIAPLGVLLVLGLIVVVAGVLMRQRNTSPPASSVPSAITKAPEAPLPAQPEPQAQPEPAKPEKVAKRDEPKPKSEPAAETPAPETPAVDEAGTPGQPMPQVTAQARNTIRGKVKLTIRVDIDPAGAVTDAKIEGSGGSRYFSELALKTVRQWKFEPVKVNGSDTSQRWRVRFEFLKSGTKVQRQRLSP